MGVVGVAVPRVYYAPLVGCLEQGCGRRPVGVPRKGADDERAVVQDNVPAVSHAATAHAPMSAPAARASLTTAAQSQCPKVADLVAGFEVLSTRVQDVERR